MLRWQAEVDELYETALAAYLTWDLAHGDSADPPRLPAQPRTRVTEAAHAAAEQVRSESHSCGGRIRCLGTYRKLSVNQHAPSACA